jgi:hypothetical protein
MDASVGIATVAAGSTLTLAKPISLSPGVTPTTGGAGTMALAQNHNGTVSLEQADLLGDIGGAGSVADWALAQSIAPEPTALTSWFGLTIVLRRRRAERTIDQPIQLSTSVLTRPLPVVTAVPRPDSGAVIGGATPRFLLYCCARMTRSAKSTAPSAE